MNPSVALAVSPAVSQLPLLWLVAALLFTIVEILIPSFGCILVAGAALLTSVLANYLHAWELQVFVFAVAVFLSLFMLRPKLIAKIQKSAQLPSRTEVLFGKSGVVTEDIGPAGSPGRVMVEGQDWAAQSKASLPEGTAIVVESADGIVLHVRKADKK